MKTMKICKTIPILQNVLVKDGRAIVTDMDIQISYPSDKFTGLYHVTGFTEYPQKSDLNVDDFPVFADLGKAENINMNVSADSLAYVAGAMSKKDIRYYLMGVYFHAGKMVATNGHILFLESTENDFGAGKILPAEAVKLILSVCKEQKQKSFSMEILERGFKVKIAEVEILAKAIDGTFPDYERVIPELKRQVIQFSPECFDYKKVKMLAKINNDKIPNIKIEVDGCILYNSKPVGKLSGSIPFSIVFNAEYLSAMPGGNIQLGETANSPCRIDSGKKLAVIMPVRI